VDELTAPPDRITRVYVVDNEITYLAVPVPAGAMARSQCLRSKGLPLGLATGEKRLPCAAEIA
jgi:hypothetical protein